jgi:cell division transport system permease protein
MKPPIRSQHYKQSKAKPAVQGNAWLWHHIQVFWFSLGHIVRTPLPSLMMAAVIGIALALPTGLYLLLENAQQISHGWGFATQISLFLKQDVKDTQVRALANHLFQHPSIANVRIITPAEALEEYRTLSGFGDALIALEDNPLPAVLVIQPATNNVAASQQLLENLAKLPNVDIAQFDMLWLKRLFMMIEIVRRGVLILATLLSLAVLLVVGNTIRLAIYNRRDEIEVYKLVGATDAFIQRPFLYMGFWFGLAGGLIAWLLVTISFWFIQEPVRQLMILYDSQLELITLKVLSSLILLSSSILLGLLGAWLAVRRHLKDIQPR